MQGNRAATYVRASTDEQENSPERQLNQIRAYCERKGYRVVRQYEDMGMRGYDDSRPQFQKLISDAKSGHFDVIVVDEQSRLARNDPVKFIARVIDPLRDANVAIDTVAKGVLDWDDLGDFIVGAVSQHAASGEVITLSRRVVTELARKALSGDVVAGKPPYGYTQVWLDKAGNLVHEGRRTWTRRPTGWTPSLRINEDEAEVVRFIFDAYVNQDLSLNGIMKELRAKGIASPRGGPYWSRAHLRNMLTNRVYVGDYVFNRVSVGTFHRLSWQGKDDGRVGLAEPKRMSKTQGRRTNPITKNDQKDWVVITDHHEALVDRELFKRAAAALGDNRERKTPKPSRGDYCLSKILVCKACGNWMVGDRDPRGLKFYICGGYYRYGLQMCRPFRIREDSILEVVAENMRRHLLSPERIDQLRAEARSYQERLENGRDLARWTKEVEKLDRNIRKGRSNLLLLEGDGDTLRGLHDEIREWERKRDAIQGNIEKAQRENPVKDTEVLIKKLQGLLGDFVEAMRGREPAAIRKVVRDVMSKMELVFSTERKAVRNRYHLTGGSVYFFAGDSYVFGLKERENDDGEDDNNQSWLWSSSQSLVVPFSCGETPRKRE